MGSICLVLTYFFLLLNAQEITLDDKLIEWKNQFLDSWVNMKYGYSGVNSGSFIEGYERHFFDKSGLILFFEPHLLYVANLNISLSLGKFTYINGSYPARRAIEVVEYYGDIPVVFRTKLAECSEHKFYKGQCMREWKIYPPKVKIDKIYIVRWANMFFGAFLEEISFQELEFLHFDNLKEDFFMLMEYDGGDM